MKKDFLSVLDLKKEEMEDVFSTTALLKKEPFSKKGVLKDKTVCLIFQKPSNRTRVSFEVGAIELGGSSVYLGPDDIAFGKRESIKDIARVLSRYVQLMVLRTFSHDNILELAKYSDIPVINGLSDLLHPCQAMADIFTIREKLTDVKGRTLAFVGDGNNVLHSLLQGASMVGMNVKIATPKGYGPNEAIVKKAKELGEKAGSRIEINNDPKDAVREADVIYTDVWVSMGQESEKAARVKAFKGFQVNSELVGMAKKDVLVMHCLPAHRDEEITDEVIESKNSIVFDQAENRLHVQKAIMCKLIA